jgi:hypothetical protein
VASRRPDVARALATAAESETHKGLRSMARRHARV